VLSKKTDEELMIAYQLGDEAAFVELYKRYSNRVYGFLRSKIRDEIKVQDVFQAAFLKFHKTKTQYNPSLPFIPWLFTICRNELLDFFKKDRLLKEDLTGEEINTVLEDSTAKQDLDVSLLNPAQKQAIEMRFVQESSFEEIANALKTSPSNARQLVSRAVKVLRSLYVRK
jgi:RNA polymerase sigma-70 factor (ECF subfamily)